MPNLSPGRKAVDSVTRKSDHSASKKKEPFVVIQYLIVVTTFFGSTYKRTFLSQVPSRKFRHTANQNFRRRHMTFCSSFSGVRLAMLSSTFKIIMLFAVITLLFPRTSVATSLSNGLSDPDMQPKFREILPNPLLPSFVFNTTGGYIEVSVGEGEAETGLLGPDGETPVSTPIWGYGTADIIGHTWPGRTFVVQSGEPLRVKWLNNIPISNGYLLTGKDNGGSLDFMGLSVINSNASYSWCYNVAGYQNYTIEKDGTPIIPHLHGGYADAAYDGEPDQFFTPNFQIKGPNWEAETFVYDNNQSAACLWYHDHAHGITRFNVYAGMAGFYIVRDNVDTGRAGNVKNLPAYPYELPLVVQDRMFKENGELFYPTFKGDPTYLDFMMMMNRRKLNDERGLMEGMTMGGGGMMDGSNSSMNGSNSTMNGSNSSMNGSNSTMNGSNSSMNGSNSTMNGSNNTMNGSNSTMNGSNSTMGGNNGSSMSGGSNGSMNGGNSMSASEHMQHMTGMAEFFGDHMTVNGKIWPKANVEPRNYRLRLLNGCDSRTMVVEFMAVTAGQKDFENATAVEFYVVGGDRGFADTITTTKSLVFEPGARYDVVINFAPYNGSRIIMKNLGGDEPFAGQIPGVQFFNHTDKVMAFDVKIPFNSTIPDKYVPEDPAVSEAALTEPNRVRKVGLFNSYNEHNKLVLMLGTVEPATDMNGDPIMWPDEEMYRMAGLTGQMQGALAWHDPITENIKLNDVEDWEIWNLGQTAHPVHLHLVNFRVLGRKQIVYDSGMMMSGDGMGQMGGMSPVGDGTYLMNRTLVMYDGTVGRGFMVMNPTSGDEVQLNSTEYVENFPKDVVVALPGQITTIRAKFEKEGRFMWHCHMLAHEDNEMMRPFQVGPLTAEAQTSSTGVPRYSKMLVVTFLTIGMVGLLL